MKTKFTKIILLLLAFAISIQLQAQTQSPQKALSFDGVNDYVSGTTGISTSLTAITIEAWVYNNTLPAGTIQRYVTIQPEVAVLRYDGSGLGGTNELHFYIKNASGAIVSLRVNNVLSTGTWMHIAGTYDGTTMKLYLNGKLLKSGAAVGLTAPSGAFLFGANGAEAFNGKMDEVSVWNYARSMADIREDMYRNAPTANANLKNYWQFNNGSGTTLTDLKGTATGTLNNMDNTNWIASTIPFAAGAVNTQRVTTTGTTTFTGTGLVANFTAKSGTDTIVASRIDTLANVSPTDVTTAFNSQYWVIKRFGTGTFTSNLTFTVNDDITSVQAAHPNLLKLYKRESNNDGSWTLVAAATSADDVNNTVTFNGLTSFDGQYMVCFSSPTNTVGTALNFDGTNDYVDCGNASSLNVSKITIEAWINADTWNANSWGGTIVSKENTNGTGYSLRCGNNGMLSFVIGVSGGWHELLSGAVMQTGRWNYVAGVYDGANMSIYVNGVRAGQKYITGSIDVSSQSLFIGNSPGYPTRFFDGKIDEVRLFNVARTEAQIRSDMCNTLTGTETGLVNYWQFNNGSGTTLTDVVGSSTGTLTNMDAATCWVESYAMVVPVPAAASSSFTTGFTANWTAPAIGTVTSYKLDVSTNNTFTALVSGYNDLDCGNNLSKDVTGLTNGTTYYYRVRADKTSVTGTGGNHYTYTTYAPTVINTQSTASQEVCLNQVFTAISVSATGDNLSYQWYSNTSNSNSDGSSLNSANGAQTNTYKPQQGTTPGILYYYCVVTGNHGTATSAVSGEFVTRPPIITSQSTAAQTQPIYGTFTPITVTAVGANLTYQWYSNASAFNSGGTSLGTDNGAQTNSYTPQATTAGTLYYYCIVTGACGPVTSQVSGAFIVNPIELAGSGSAGDPFRIANLNNLYYLTVTPYLWDKGYTFIQTANINAAETRNWDGGQGFIPIGNEPVKFQGNYHGKGNSIDSLYINRPGSMEVAFFGYIYKTPSGVKSSIDSLSLTNVNITGLSYVGGLGGMATDFNISHCSVIGGSVTATNSQYSAGVGGMFGCTSGAAANNNSTSHCFAAVAVSGQGEVGGFVGQTYGGYINQCYSAGLVSGTGEYVGGFVGYRMSLGVPYSLDSSYYDIQASGQATGAGRNDQPAYNHLQGKTTAEMKTQATYDGWNFSTVWKISGSVNNGYPYFDYPTQISTATVSNIANNTATATGTISHIGALAITAHGFCWNTTGAPTLADGKINLGATTTSGDYSGSITGLSHNTTYYLRAYAIDAQDTIYGNVVNFTTTNVITGGTCIKVTTPPSGAIRIPDNNGLNLTNNYSIEAWINPDAYHADSKKYFLRKGLFTGTKVSGYYLARTGGGNSLGLVFDDMITADNILSEGKWNHIAAVNDNGTRHIYVNGVEYPLTGTPKTVIANSDPLFIGSSQKAGSMSPFTGKFDEISVWNKALSESQVREHMHFSFSGTETGLVSYWQCDEGSGGTVSDKMGVNNGAIVKLSSQYEDVYVVDPNPNPKWFVSTIPFGMGYSNTQVVTATGTNTFTNAGLAMNFTAKTGMDSIVVARIDTFPNINPTGLNAVFDRQYWAVHKYGTGTFTANLTFTINEDLTAEDESLPTKIKLYTRSGMADDSTWTYVTSAVSVDAATHQATFNGITDFGQYILARGICTVNIPDANFKTALLAIPGLDANSDEEISCIEAYNYTGDMNVNLKSIADLTGIEAFTNITKLYCNQNNLTSLNISALTLLTDLDCSNNQLTAIDVLGNTALINFNCDNNLLASLNVSGNTSLNYLLCRYNQLTSLDVSANSALIGLYCNNNDVLTNLKVSGLTSLTRINCSVNQITNLDFSSNTALERLACSYNSLTSLNVKNGNNTNISDAYFDAKNNSSLTCIQVDDATWSTTNWTNKDAGASFSNDCGYTVYSIAATVSPVSTGTITGAGNYIQGDNVPLVATANTGYTFVNWTEGGTQVSTDAAYSFSATANRTLIANFVVSTYTIAASANLAGAGTIGGAGDYNHGDVVSLIANANTGYTFSNWTEGTSTVSTNATYSFAANSDRTLIANFSINTFTLDYTADANGSITGTANQTVNYGASGIAVTALPNTNYHFVDWSDASTANPRTDANVTANINVTANFAINTFTLDYTADANGTISGTANQTVNYGADGTEVTAVPNTGSHFVDWSDASTTNPRTDLNVTANLSVTANFAINTFTLDYTADANGSITGILSQTINYNENGTEVTAVPNAGYHFVDWSDASTQNPRTDLNITANIDVTANFAINTFTLDYIAGANGSVTGDLNQTVNYGADGTQVTAVPNTGYHFVDWSDASTTNPRTDLNVTANINVSANFAINTFTLDYTAGANGSITGILSQTINYNENGTEVTAVPNAGYHFVDWSDASTTNPRTDLNVTANIDVTANFAINTFTLDYTAGANGTITGTANQTVNYGANGTQVTAVANAGYHFVDWSDASTTNPRTDLNVTSNITLTANFSINTFTLDYTAGANGTITGTANQTVNYGSDGTEVTAVPNTGYHFVDWSDASTTNPRTDLNVTANINVSANFAINTFTLDYTAGANGTITGDLNQTVNYGSDGTEVTAVPNANYHFVDWSDASSTNPRTDLNITANVDVTANFAVNSYLISASVSPVSTGTITGDGNYNYGDNVSLIATPNAGYTFVNWTEGGTQVSTDATFAFTATANRTLVANFEVIIGISDLNETNSIIVYPNPNAGQFAIDFENNYNGELTVKIYSIDGSIIKELKTNKSSNKFSCNIDLGNVANGTYFIDIITSKEKVVKTIGEF